LGFSSCENDITVINSLIPENQLPLESEKNVEYIYSDSALIRAKLTAPRMDRYGGKKTYMELPKGMHVIFYNEGKKEQTNLTADYGIGYDDGSGMNKMEAKRNVVVINEKGDRLNTEHLIWDAVTKQIYTEEFVKITTKEQTIWGDGLRADQDFSKYRILHPKGFISVNDNTELTKEKEEKK
jgi:LPS export ABC transporter protein LptC